MMDKLNAISKYACFYATSSGYKTGNRLNIIVTVDPAVNPTMNLLIIEISVNI